MEKETTIECNIKNTNNQLRNGATGGDKLLVALAAFYSEEVFAEDELLRETLCEVYIMA